MRFVIYELQGGQTGMTKKEPRRIAWEKAISEAAGAT
jgi:hypothetical protein